MSTDLWDMNTLIGVALTITGGIVQSFGFILEKKGHIKVNKLNETLSKQDDKSVLTQWIWWIGIAIYSIGGLLNAVALIYAAQSIIAPLGALDLATNAILSYFILKETITKTDIIAILIIIVGSITVVLFGPLSDNTDITIDELREYYEQIPYIVTISLLTAICLIDFIGIKYAENKNFQSDTNDDITYGKNFLLFSWIWIAAFFGSMNILFIKSCCIIISSSFQSSDAMRANLSDYLIYIMFILVVITMCLMEYFRQKALAHFGTKHVISLFEVISIILTTVIGMIYFQEFQLFTAINAWLFSLGIITSLCGVFILSYDIGELLSELYDHHIKVAFIEYETCDHKYAKTIIIGGPCSEYFQHRNLKQCAVCYNKAIQGQSAKYMDKKVEDETDNEPFL